MGGSGGEAKAAVLSTGGVDGGERLDGGDDCRDHALGRGEVEGFVGEVFGTGVVTVGGGENRFKLGVESTADEADAEATGMGLIADRTGGVEVVAPQGKACCTDGHREGSAGESSCVGEHGELNGAGVVAMERGVIGPKVRGGGGVGAVFGFTGQEAEGSVQPLGVLSHPCGPPEQLSNEGAEDGGEPIDVLARRGGARRRSCPTCWR